MPTQEELDLLTLDDIMDVLERRYESVAVVYKKRDENVGARYRGCGSAGFSGMLSQALWVEQRWWLTGKETDPDG